MTYIAIYKENLNNLNIYYEDPVGQPMIQTCRQRVRQMFDNAASSIKTV